MVKSPAQIFISNAKSEYGLFIAITMFSVALISVVVFHVLDQRVEAVESNSLLSETLLMQPASIDLHEEICDPLIVEPTNNNSIECNGEGYQAPTPIGLPTEVPEELPEEDKDGLNESVAGNEELIAQPAETVEQASNNVATTINTDIPRRVLRVVADAATPGDQNVLGAQATDDSAQGNNPEPKPVIASGLQKPSLPKEGTKLWWILGAGFVAVILPATFAYARQHSE